MFFKDMTCQYEETIITRRRSGKFANKRHCEVPDCEFLAFLSLRSRFSVWIVSNKIALFPRGTTVTTRRMTDVNGFSPG